MSSIRTLHITAAAACILLGLTACGGGDSGDSSALTVNCCGNGSNTAITPLSRADEGIWSGYHSSGFYGMQVVILSDGSYWGVDSVAQTTGDFCPGGVLQGSASINGGNVSGAYADFSNSPVTQGAYTGTVTAQNNLNLIFTPLGVDSAIVSTGDGVFNMSYDSIYNQPAALASIAGNYANRTHCFTNFPYDGPGAYYNITPNLTVSGSNLSLADQDGNVIMTGTVAPHGTTVNVFDVSMKTAAAVKAFSMYALRSPDDVPAGTVYKGILFQTDYGTEKNNVEIIAASENSAFAYLGGKQN